MDQNEREQRIREHAHSLWEQEGRPEGRHEDHWRQASEAVGPDGDTTGGADSTSGSVGTDDTGSGGTSAGDSGSA